MIYVLLILLAITMNYWHDHSVLLAGIVGLAIVLPYPAGLSYFMWFVMAISAEFLVMFSAIMLRTKFSIPIILLSALFIVVHLTGFSNCAGPIGQYHNFAITLEYTELLACVLLSETSLKFIRSKLL